MDIGKFSCKPNMAEKLQESRQNKVAMPLRWSPQAVTLVKALAARGSVSEAVASEEAFWLGANALAEKYGQREKVYTEIVGKRNSTKKAA